ncbi:hypothetical protein AYO21_09787 [Fonsecaea monophora]|uniref:Uncharacterized protein n=1 Tax=Fonsecaea monophora TaxID=254056 RepID=A0A177EVD8_9EURO|nr:hypothetical protein AYO21_09787 [Fonsecaea monophora]OAG35994.1 hypothetical protein AYO21_09787 [Fonsecaea monophora]
MAQAQRNGQSPTVLQDSTSIPCPGMIRMTSRSSLEAIDACSCVMRTVIGRTERVLGLLAKLPQVAQSSSEWLAVAQSGLSKDKDVAVAGGCQASVKSFHAFYAVRVV